MKERPILFSAPMVRAILDGRKTMTRRVVQGAPTWESSYVLGVHQGVWGIHAHVDAIGAFRARCPYGEPGDRLWVRETWAEFVDVVTIDGSHVELGRDFIYRADGEDQKRHTVWRPSIHMPRAASRLTLEITGVRVERLKDITEADAIAEGLTRDGDGWRGAPKLPWFASPIAAFRSLWESINGGGSWDENPFVWVVEFRRIEQEAKAA